MTYRLYMMTEADRAALNRLNETLAAGISAAVADGAGTKVGEGGIRIELPAFYDLDAPCSVRLFLTVYVIGPTRQYCWVGESVAEACAKAQGDVEHWIREDSAL